MFTQLVRSAVGTCVDIGREVLHKLRADARLAEVATRFGAAQASLQTTATMLEEARQAAKAAVAALDDAERRFGQTVREFAMFVLATVKNHHDVDPYLQYFPNGYGDAVRLEPEEMLQFTGVLLTQLETETSPKLVAYREELQVTREAFRAALDAAENAVRARKDAFQLQKAEKREWVRSLAEARRMADTVCYAEASYIRLIFSPARPHPGKVASKDPDSEEPPEASEDPGEEDVVHRNGAE